ncbi:KdsC family phosphatase [Magnetococcales bacterium HHB-1]
MKVRLIVFDFDGVLTDNRVIVMENGLEAVICNRGDGLAFDILRDAGIPCLILSTETNPVVSQRAKKIKVPVLQAIEDKAEALRNYCEEHNIPLEEVMFVGNDLNDLPALRIVGYPVLVGDAHPKAFRANTIHLKTNGGAGVAREIVDDLLRLPSRYE